jgi:hypothetical protein
MMENMMSMMGGGGGGSGGMNPAVMQQAMAQMVACRYEVSYVTVWKFWRSEGCLMKHGHAWTLY